MVPYSDVDWKLLQPYISPLTETDKAQGLIRLRQLTEIELKFSVRGAAMHETTLLRQKAKFIQETAQLHPFSKMRFDQWTDRGRDNFGRISIKRMIDLLATGPKSRGQLMELPRSVLGVLLFPLTVYKPVPGQNRGQNFFISKTGGMARFSPFVRFFSR